MINKNELTSELHAVTRVQYFTQYMTVTFLITPPKLYKTNHDR